MPDEQDPTPERIEELARRLPWRNITWVTLTRENGDWIECSGAHADGFCVIYQEGGAGYISADEPSGLDQIILVLQDYAMGGSLWKELFSWDDYQR